ncbi:hypothetical protein M3Y94_00660000 [Aphelenchoides besseyi]|nr:hypothetical protein M3Y94_00660000 [Aphelenchoides besseyi]KAI6231240.1 Lysosomal aspartic protease-like protein [Aphelenchoides besseyi]
MFSESGVISFNILSWYTLNISIGSPPQSFNAIFDFATVPLLITAEDCGHRPKDCPRMCKDEFIASVYCEPLCFPISSLVHNGHCFRSFQATDSSTYRRSTASWRESLQSCKDPLYGRFVSDKIRIEYSTPSTEFTLEFVEGTLLQENAVVGSDGIFGLGFRDESGSVGVVEQLYAQQVIRQPIISLVSSITAVLGALDTNACDSWSHFPIASDALGWTFQVKKLEFFGVQFENQQITFGNQPSHLRVPEHVRRELIRRGLVLDGSYYEKVLWYVQQNVKTTLVLFSDYHDYKLELPKVGSSCVYSNNQTFCDVLTENLQSVRSNGPNSWILPIYSSYFSTLCWGLNYANRSVVVGRYLSK